MFAASKVEVRAVAALFALALGTTSISSNAVLERVGPINPAPTHASLPAWYQDTTGLALEFCAPTNPAEVTAGLCLVGPAEVPNFPEFFPGNFFDEHFYYDASASLTTPAGAKIIVGLAVEANAAVPGDQVVFSRIRVRFNDIPLTGAYRFIHPYGDETFQGVAGDRIFVTDDMGIGVPGVFTDAMNSRLGPFLVPTNAYGSTTELPPYTNPAVPGKVYLADPGRLGPVTGSQATNPATPELAPGMFYPRASTAINAAKGAPRSQNVFRVEGPVGSNIGGSGINFIETTNFSLIGRIFTGVIPGRVDVNRASYTRNAAGQKLDVFATGSSTTQGRIPPQPRPLPVLPTLSFFDVPCASALDANGFPVPPYSAPTSTNETSMLSANGIYWGQIAPAAIPTAVCVKDGNAKDANGNVVPAYIPRNVADVVTIDQMTWDPSTGTMTAKARSSDETAPPTLSLAYGTYLGVLDASGQIDVPNVIAPPDKARVISSKFGVNDSQVSTNASAAPNTPPVAVNDTATTTNGTPVTIAVLANDTDADANVLSVTTLSAVTPTVAGTAVRNVNNTVTFTPAATGVGVATFAYGVSDGAGGTAAATVSVTVTQALNRVPVANADTASTAPGTPVTINVLVNDTDPDGDPLSVLAITNGANGAVVTNGTSVTYTPNAGFSGSNQFTYTVADGRGGQATGTVTVTVAAGSTVTVTLADFIVSGSEWRVAGTDSTIGATVTVRLGANLTGPVIGTAVVSAARTWTLRVRNSNVQPGAINTIFTSSTDGATRLTAIRLR